MFTIKQLSALEILDSRGRPTIRTTCVLEGGFAGVASVPSGASTGRAEAVELRDGDAGRYRGMGCRKAVENVGVRLNQALAGREFGDQSDLDLSLIREDGTSNKAGLGANAILSVSLAFARAAALQQGLPLYRYFGERLGLMPKTLSRQTINLFSGGKHAGGQVPIQDVLVVPASATTFDEALSMTFAVYQCAAEWTAGKYGARALTADEGGLAPPFPNAEAMLEDAVRSIERAGFTPGREVALAVDVASTHFFENGIYRMGTRSLNSAEMVEQLAAWVSHYPIVSLEDGLAEDDWDAWPALRERVCDRARVVGDDLLCTNPERIRRAIQANAADTLLLKVNQIGTVSEAADACRLARSAGWQVTVSARSGETEDNWLADLAVGWRGDQIKVGSITQSERLSKYNRMLEIEADTRLPLVDWPRAAD